MDEKPAARSDGREQWGPGSCNGSAPRRAQNDNTSGLAQMLDVRDQTVDCHGKIIADCGGLGRMAIRCWPSLSF